MAVAAFRPKASDLDFTQSATEFVGLYLKANNVSTKDWIRKSHSQKLSKFMDDSKHEKII